MNAKVEARSRQSGARSGNKAGTCTPRARRTKRAASEAEVAGICKALGDENRLAMVQMIAEAGELCACEIERNFALSQPTVSHHLKLLRTSGVIEGTRRGTWIFYSIVPGTLRLVAEHPIFEH